MKVLITQFLHPDVTTSSQIKISSAALCSQTPSIYANYVTSLWVTLCNTRLISTKFGIECLHKKLTEKFNFCSCWSSVTPN
jgi:hypothetical protein